MAFSTRHSACPARCSAARHAAGPPVRLFTRPYRGRADRLRAATASTTATTARAGAAGESRVYHNVPSYRGHHADASIYRLALKATY